MTRCVAAPGRAWLDQSAAPEVSGVHIQASVGRNGANRFADVQTIQKALNSVAPDQGGPTPQLRVDGICGPLTQRAIERFQQRQLGWFDGRVDPNRETLARLNAAQSSSGGEALGFDIGKATSLLSKAAETVPVAKTWIVAARMNLVLAAGAASPTGGSWPIVNTHFHLDKVADPVAKANQISAIFFLMEKAIGSSSLFKQYSNPPDSRFAEADLGGFWLSSGSRNEIRICPPFGGLWIKSRTAVVVHELAHLVGGFGSADTIKHFAWEMPSPNGTAQEGTRDYASLLPAEALRNAASYATFAIHAAYGFDNRAGWI